MCADEVKVINNRRKMMILLIKIIECYILSGFKNIQKEYLLCCCNSEFSGGWLYELSSEKVYKRQDTRHIGF